MSLALSAISSAAGKLYDETFYKLFRVGINHNGTSQWQPGCYKDFQSHTSISILIDTGYYTVNTLGSYYFLPEGGAVCLVAGTRIF